MDTWKFYDITHRHHLVCNPTNEQKLEELIDRVKLPAKSRVLDIASGKGEFLIRVIERYHAQGLGIDISPFCIEDAGKRARGRVPETTIEFRHMNGADYTPRREESFALASCLGASWIFKGHRGTLQALTRMVRPGGWVVAGEPFWMKDPSDAFLAETGDQRSDFGTHLENVEAGEQLGLRPTYAIVSNPDDWDRYEGLQWYATEEYARAHPEDPDVPELVSRVNKDRSAYLRWGRDTMGWAIYVFQRP